MDKNSLYRTNGNTEIDELLYTIENLDIISKNFTNKIKDISLWILSNSKDNESEIKNAIENLYDLMRAIKIFDSLFIKKVYLSLIKGLEFEKNRTHEK